MKREFITILIVFLFIASATWLLTGTGFLTGFFGMFLRVLLGFALLGLTAQILCRRQRTATDYKDPCPD